jgi:predicted nucleic acid-binding protein
MVVSKMEAVIPKEMVLEACEVKRSVDALLIQGLIGQRRITVVPLKDRAIGDKLRRDLGLGTGEAEAIVLALWKRADLVATDDRRTIDACKLVKLPFTSAPAILVRMYERGPIDREPALRKLEILEREGRYKKGITAAMRMRLEG